MQDNTINVNNWLEITKVACHENGLVYEGVSDAIAYLEGHIEAYQEVSDAIAYLKGHIEDHQEVSDAIAYLQGHIEAYQEVSDLVSDEVLIDINAKIKSYQSLMLKLYKKLDV